MGNFPHNPAAVWWLPPDQRPAPEQVRRMVCLALKAGADERTAAALAEVPWDDYQRFLKVDPTFAVQVASAKATVVVRAAGQVRSAAMEDWRAAQLLLQRAAQDGELDRLKGMTTDGS